MFSASGTEDTYAASDVEYTSISKGLERMAFLVIAAAVITMIIRSVSVFDKLCSNYELFRFLNPLSPMVLDFSGY